MSTKTTKSSCKAKNPALCPYHGKGYDLARLESEASTAATSGDFESYSYIRNAMDEIIRDKAFELKTIDSDAATDSTRQLVRDDIAAAATEASVRREAQVKYHKQVSLLDQKYAATDKQAAQRLKLRLAAAGGVSFKFYNPYHPAQLEPEKFDAVDTTTAGLKAGDFIGNGTILKTERGVGTPTGKTEVIYARPDGRVERGIWWNSTKIRVSRPKEAVSV